MRFVQFLFFKHALVPICGEFSIEPDVSTTSTISNGLLTVFTVFDVDDNADNPTKKSESPFLTLGLLPPSS